MATSVCKVASATWIFQREPATHKATNTIGLEIGDEKKGDGPNKGAHFSLAPALEVPAVRGQFRAGQVHAQNKESTLRSQEDLYRFVLFFRTISFFLFISVF